MAHIRILERDGLVVSGPGGASRSIYGRDGVPISASRREVDADAPVRASTVIVEEIPSAVASASTDPVPLSTVQSSTSDVTASSSTYAPAPPQTKRSRPDDDDSEPGCWANRPECSICCLDYTAERQPLVYSACGHGFCQTCCSKWGTTCPECRKTSGSTVVDFVLCHCLGIDAKNSAGGSKRPRATPIRVERIAQRVEQIVNAERDRLAEEAENRVIAIVGDLVTRGTSLVAQAMSESEIQDMKTAICTTLRLDHKRIRVSVSENAIHVELTQHKEYVLNEM